jgi:hypothetical protein
MTNLDSGKILLELADLIVTGRTILTSGLVK